MKLMKTFKVLLATANADYVRWLENSPTLKGRVKLITVFDFEEVQKKLAKHPDLTAIVLTERLPLNWTSDSTISTLSLMPEIKGKFTGPIFGMADTQEVRHELLSAGCTYMCSPESLPRILLDVLMTVGHKS